LKRTGIEAARRKFAPEFINRLDNIIVFRALGETELKKILDLELGFVQERIFLRDGGDVRFVITAAETVKTYLLQEGTDPRYGARHLKRAIERLVVRPLSRDITSGRIRTGDHILVDLEAETRKMIFRKTAENLNIVEMRRVADSTSSN
jgi:ATP-dependent Clp protease ATP-binding subunit ClpB